MLDRRDITVEALAHGVFEREGLDDADALQRFLQRFQDARAAVELGARDDVDAADQLAQNQECRRRHDKGEERHQRVLNHHDGDQPNQRQQIAAERDHQEIDHLGRGRCAGRQPRDEFGRMPVGEELQAFVEQLGEHRALIIGDDAVADMRQQHAVAVGGEAFDGKQRRGNGAEHHDAGQVLVDVSLVDDVAD